MLNFNPSSLRTSFVDAAANLAAGGASANGAADPAGFASLLRQTQTAPKPSPVPAPAPAPAPPPSAENDAATQAAASNEAPDEAAAPRESDSASRARTLQRGKLRAADGTSGAGGEGKPTLDPRDTRDTRSPEATDTPPGGDCLAPETKLTATGTPIDPSVMQWLASQQRIAINTDLPKGHGKGTAEPAATLDTTDTGATESAGSAKHLRAADLKADAELKDKAALGKASFADAAGAVGTSPFAAALKEQGLVEKLPLKLVDSAKDVGPASAAAPSPAAATGTEAAPPTAVPIATPVTAPDFAQELGLRLSVLAKDGVQTAELHLNPADMGPVSVQIVMDGTQARVDFGADMATTRQAIEAGLPELASALRDAGFTLAGGGVSQHAGGRSGGGSDASGGDTARRIVVEDDVKRVATAARRIVRQGGVDLFA